jgi:hypothetical protein
VTPPPHPTPRAPPPPHIFLPHNPVAGGPLTAKEYKERLVTSEGTQSVQLPRANYSIRYAYVSQRGYYPDSPDKPNQVRIGLL